MSSIKEAHQENIDEDIAICYAIEKMMKNRRGDPSYNEVFLWADQTFLNGDKFVTPSSLFKKFKMLNISRAYQMLDSFSNLHILSRVHIKGKKGIIYVKNDSFWEYALKRAKEKK